MLNDERILGNNQISRNDIEKTALKLKGIPYQHNGRSLNGLDCWGLVQLFFAELKIELPSDDGKEITRDWYKIDPDRYHRQLNKLGQEVGHYNNLLSLDIPYFRLYKNVVTHTSVMLDHKKFIHILIDKKVSIDTIDRRYWRRKYAGARRVLTGNNCK